MSKLRLLGASSALVASALVGGTLISAVVAAPAAAPSAATSAAVTAQAADPSAYCTAFRAAFAKELGVSEAQVTAAAKSAIGSAVDQAVKDGTLTEAAGARLKERVAAASGDGCKLLGGWRGRVAGKALGVAKDGITAAADSLDLTVAVLRDQLKSGKSLKDVATAQGVPYETVSGAVTTAVQADLDAAVKAGTITQARADRILDRVERRLENGWTKAGRQGQTTP